MLVFTVNHGSKILSASPQMQLRPLEAFTKLRLSESSQIFSLMHNKTRQTITNPLIFTVSWQPLSIPLHRGQHITTAPFHHTIQFAPHSVVVTGHEIIKYARAMLLLEGSFDGDIRPLRQPPVVRILPEHQRQRARRSYGVHYSTCSLCFPTSGFMQATSGG